MLPHSVNFEYRKALEKSQKYFQSGNHMYSKSVDIEMKCS